MRTCLYCNKEKKDEEFSKEHVLPKAVGGAISPVNPFSITDVCRKCNNLSGRFIDGPFIKEYSMSGFKATNALEFIKLSSNTVIPFFCFGEIEDLKLNERICEYWHGPNEDSIYHFHKPYPQEDNLPSVVGVPPTVNPKDIDPGFTFIFLHTNNPNWEVAIYNSLKATFKNSVFYVGNRPSPRGGIFATIPKSLKSLHEKLKAKQAQSHRYKFSIKPNNKIEDRFYAKMALGLGSIVLGASYKNSDSANLLRQYMWTKDFSERQKMDVLRTSVFGDAKSHEILKELGKYYYWEGGHLFIVTIINNTLFLYTNIYETFTALIPISNEKKYWGDNIKHGLCYIVVPGLQAAAGPVMLKDFRAHKDEGMYQNEEIAKLQELMNIYKNPPPFYV